MTTSNRNRVPIACDLRVFTSDELRAHLTRAIDVVFRRARMTTEMQDGFLLEYEGDESLFLELARFVHAEHRCCPWVSFSLEMEPFDAGTAGPIRLRYIGGIEGKAVLVEAFRQLRDAAGSTDGPRRLLAALGGPEPCCGGGC